MTERKCGAAPLDVFPSRGFIGEGERSDAAGVLQMILNALKIRYDCYGFLDLTLALDGPTAAAVSAFRRAHAIPDSPGVDIETWNELAGEYAALKDME